MVSEITVHEFLALRRANTKIFLLDVRTPEEYAAHNMDGYLIPLPELAARLEELAKLSQEQHIVVHCHSGYRSHVAADILMQHGFQNVQNLIGGIQEWSKTLASQEC